MVYDFEQFSSCRERDENRKTHRAQHTLRLSITRQMFVINHELASKQYAICFGHCSNSNSDIVFSVYVFRIVGEFVPLIQSVLHLLLCMYVCVRTVLRFKLKFSFSLPIPQPSYFIWNFSCVLLYIRRFIYLCLVSFQDKFSQHRLSRSIQHKSINTKNQQAQTKKKFYSNSTQQ